MNLLLLRNMNLQNFLNNLPLKIQEKITIKDFIHQLIYSDNLQQRIFTPIKCTVEIYNRGYIHQLNLHPTNFKHKFSKSRTQIVKSEEIKIKKFKEKISTKNINMHDSSQDSGKDRQ